MQDSPNAWSRGPARDDPPAERRLQLRRGSLRSLGATLARELLPLQAMSAAEWYRRFGAGAPGPGQLPDRRRSREAADVETTRQRRREVVLRRLRVGDLRLEPQSSRIGRHPDGDVRR